MKLQQEKVESMIFCWAYGDSLWIPVEMQTAEQIQEILKAEWVTWTGRVKQFLSPQYHKLYREWEYDTNALVVSSDDTHCSRALLQSLWTHRDIDWHDIMDRNIAFYRKCDFWYGGTTKQAYQNYLDGAHPLNAWVEGWWNGVIMKLAPLSAYIIARGYNIQETKDILEDFSRLTHTHVEVIIATHVHHRVLEYLLLHDNLDGFWTLLMELKEICDNYWESSSDFSIKDVIERISQLYDSGTLFHMSDTDIRENFWRGENKITAYSGRIDTTLGICYASFLRNPHMDGIIDVISLGWDTDTYWAIVGNMVWALQAETPDTSMMSQIPDIEIIEQETKTFVAMLNDVT